MSLIFHRSANTIARVRIFGAVFFIAALLGPFDKINRSPSVHYTIFAVLIQHMVDVGWW
jgi:hypothetical protein